jgi:fructose-1,6-bisphosphatase
MRVPLTVLQPGTEMVAAGYCMYGSMSYMMITTGKGVAGFTLDPTLGEVQPRVGLQSHPVPGKPVRKQHFPLDAS